MPVSTVSKQTHFVTLSTRGMSVSLCRTRSLLVTNLESDGSVSSPKALHMLSNFKELVVSSSQVEGFKVLPVHR
jgi:hypothetical protein